MSSLIANSFHFVDYSETSIDQSDLEVEEILNEIGFFANDEYNYGLFAGEPSQPATSSEAYAPVLFAPVSPEHQSFEQSTTESNSSVFSSSSMEGTENFSVPNPIAVMSSMPSFPTHSIPQRGNTYVNQTPSPKASKSMTKKDFVKGGKRKFSEVIATQNQNQILLRPASPASSHERDDADLTEEQLEERRQRNREHAKRSRLRKKSLTCTLQQSLDDLKAENVNLRQQINAMIGTDKVDSILEKRRQVARARFMNGLKQASTRILDDGTMTFLKSLQKNIPSTASCVKKQRKN